MKRKTYWVYLNGEYIADYKTLRGCLDFIERKKLEANYDNDLGIIDNEGNEYHPYTGKMMNESINEWNMWDGDRRSSNPRQTRLIDVANKMGREQMLDRKERYNNDPEYHEHIKRLENELRRTDDPQHAEYLERRISKLKSLVEGVKLSRTSRAINEMSIENFNTRIAKDFVGMVLQYINDEPDVISTGEFNYGEYDNWVRLYPELADLCMVGGNNVSDAADELLDAIFNFIRVAQRNTITSTHRREFKENDVEVVKEGVGMQNIVIKKYKNDIENFLNDYKWETIKPMDVVVEFEYGDEYYMLVQEIMDYLGIDDSNPEYDAIYYGVGPIIRNHLRKMKVWR